MTRHSSAQDCEQDAAKEGSTMSHTPEPWKTSESNQHTEIIGFPGKQDIDFIAETNADVVWSKSKLSQAGISKGQANAARIVACVNGCAGLNPAAYREVVEALKDSMATHKSILSAYGAETGEGIEAQETIEKIHAALTLTQKQP